jgi:hypoxanthine phosphoribosyltransferase
VNEFHRADIRPLYSPDQIKERVEAIARDIADSDPQDLLAIVVLKGGFVFAADLVRDLSDLGVNLEVEFISLSSYGSGLNSSGEVRILRDIGCPISDRDVLIIDDVLDSGLTLKFAKSLMEGRGAKRVAITALVDKPSGRKVDIAADYIGFTCPDYFVVGYGMDAGHAHRELPYVGILDMPENGSE